MANNQNLTAPPIRSSERAAILGSKGGKVRSPAKSLAAKLRELKAKGLTDENAKKLHELMMNPELSQLDILIFIEALKAKAQTFGEKEKLTKLMIDWSRIRHGSKDTIQQNINMLTIKDYKFSIEIVGKNEGNDNNQVESNGKAIHSIPISPR